MIYRATGVAAGPLPIRQPRTALAVDARLIVVEHIAGSYGCCRVCDDPPETSPCRANRGARRLLFADLYTKEHTVSPFIGIHRVDVDDLKDPVLTLKLAQHQLPRVQVVELAEGLLARINRDPAHPEGDEQRRGRAHHRGGAPHPVGVDGVDGADAGGRRARVGERRAAQGNLGVSGRAPVSVIAVADAVLLCMFVLIFLVVTVSVLSKLS